MLDWENERGALARDPVALLHALRRCAANVTVFCQAGRIAAPARHHPLFAHLEPMVIEAIVPNRGASFHAKTWLLRFVGDDQKVVYRFICLSRNLTPDRSWDTVLTLEGDLADRTLAIGRNNALGDFVAALPGLANKEISAERRESLSRLSAEVRRVRFSPPKPFEEIVFWPLGLPRSRRFPLEGRVDRLLIISPFLSEGLLSRVTELGADTLVSRPESLEEIAPEILKRFRTVKVLDDAATEEETDEAQSGEALESSVERISARGLHAKLFVADQGWNSSVWTGSANATDAAFGRNVEFMVQLVGKKSLVGIDAFLGGVEGNGFESVLRPFTIGERRVRDADVEANEKRVENLRSFLARAGLRLHVSRADTDAFDLVLRISGDEAPDMSGIRAHCWPAAVSAQMARDLDALWRDREIRFSGVTVHALTSFIAFEVTAGGATTGVCIRFALNLPLEGAPDDRMDRVLHAVLGNRERLIQYLLFLLARDEDVSTVGAALLSWNENRNGSGQTNATSLPLFEELLRTLARSPVKLDAIARLIDDVRGTPEGAALLPEGFDDMWKAIWEARTLHKETLR